MVESYSVIKSMKEYADKENVPIMSEDGINYLVKYISKNNVQKVLEIGTAIGYSAILMALTNENIEVTTIERDEKRYLEAVKNVKKVGLEKRINLIYNDASDVVLNEKYDLIFIDAAKAQNIRFFEKFEKNLNHDGTIITDNLNFHGLVSKKEEEIASKNLKALIRKIKNYIVFLKSNKNYDTDFLDIGDGLAVSKKKNK